MSEVLRIHDEDNAIVALTDLPAGPLSYQGRQVQLAERIPQKHKFLSSPVQKGKKVTMYGVPVGVANEDLAEGSLLTIENTTHFADPAFISEAPYAWQAPDVSAWKKQTFMGYHRPDGKVGTANLWLFIPLVFCENRNLKFIEGALNKSLGYEKPNQYEAYVADKLEQSLDLRPPRTDRIFENLDGFRFLYHDGGCGGTRQDSETLLRLLAGYVHHPNVAGATVLSLGCQHAQIEWFQEIQQELYPQSQKPIVYVEQQKLLSEEKTITTAIDQTLEYLPEVNRIQREPAGLDKLVVGLECGGSDGFSGISANPAIGRTSDLLVALGAITILSEFPELNGVEQNILDRCVTRNLGEKFLQLTQAYEERAQAVGSGFDMNPSPGNIKDGLITDAIKSAGAAQKGGTSPVCDILDYTEPAVHPGLNLLCTPGNDVESTTGMAGSGANLILFSTGLGTPTGNPITPVIKISSNTDLSTRMEDIIDINAGTIITGEDSIESMGEAILESIIETASGKPTKAMNLDQHDFILWKRGVSL
ncbi:MAG: altronate dehydratase family protein [Verrucomicrobiota bacterium]